MALRHLKALAPALLAALAVYPRAPFGFFAADDLVALARVAGLEPTPWTFRPLSAVLAFQVQHALFGLNPLGYHLVNLGLHLTAVAGVYAIAWDFTRRTGVATTAAVMFAASGIAFTPVHWVSGIGDLLACNLLLAATLVYRHGRRRAHAVLLAASVALALLAMLAKESAIAWPLIIAFLEWRARPAGTPPVLWPATAATFAMGAWLILTRPQGVMESGPYALSWGPGHLLPNLLTYLRWAVAFWDPHRDRVAAVDAGAWPVGILVAVVAVAALRYVRSQEPRAYECGLAWFASFLLPAVPLAHHTYLYYLYVPWAGGAVAVAALGAMILGRWPRPVAAVVATAALAAVTFVELDGVKQRERATFHALPADRTLREALLLGHVIQALQAAQLPPGTEVGFVNPVAGTRRFDLSRGAPTRAEDLSERRSYLPLEAVLQDGRALKLFTPGVVSRGFAQTIPAEWTNVECFLFEQRGFLRPWGRGAQALMRQGLWQDSLGQRAAADSSFARARALAGSMRPRL